MTLCRKKLVAPPAASSRMAHTSSSMLGSPDMMILPASKPIAVRSAAPPPVAAPPDPSPERTLFDDKALTDNASSRFRAAEEAQRRADELVRKEQEAMARGAKNKNAPDPFAHLKEEFAGLIHDLYGSQNDPAMAAVGAMFSEGAWESRYLLHALPHISFDTCACALAYCRPWRGRRSSCTETCRQSLPSLSSNPSTAVESTDHAILSK